MGGILERIVAPASSSMLSMSRFVRPSSLPMILFCCLIDLVLFPRLIPSNALWIQGMFPSYSSSASWFQLRPPDILFRLASLAGLVAVLLWLPVMFYASYESCGDDRSGGEILVGIWALPFAFAFAAITYAQVWTHYPFVRTRSHLAFVTSATVLFLLVLSPIWLTAGRIVFRK